MWRYRTLQGVMSLALLAGMSIPRQVAYADDEFPQEDAWHEITPSVVWCGDPASTVKIEVHIVGRSDVVGVQVTNSDENDRITLYDDGTHGDATPGDNVFTNSSVLLACSPDWLGPYGVGSWWGFLLVQLANGIELGDNNGMTAGVVHPDFKDVFEVVDFGNGLSATAYAFFIEDSQHEVFDDYPVAELFSGRGNYNAFLKFYSVMPDAFDFTLLMPGMQMLSPEGFGGEEDTPSYDVLVSNAVQNIGLDIMDNTAMFGSAGRLKSMIYHSFGSLYFFFHEVLHTWGAGIGESLGLLESPGNQSHWSPLSDISGEIGAYYVAASGDVGRFASNGDGTWHLVYNWEVVPYAPLELYLMGLIPPEEVPPIQILQSPNLRNPDRITAASYRTVTIEQIMAAEGGPRIPSSDQAQRDFDLAFIVSQDHPLDDAAYAFFSLLSYDMMSLDPPLNYGSEPYGFVPIGWVPFYWATGGRATLNTRLPVEVPDPTGPDPLPAPTEAPPETEAPDETETPAVTDATDEPPVSSEPTQAPAPGFPPFCPSALAGLALVPGIVLLRRRK